MCAQGAPLSGWTLNMIAIFSIIGSMPVNDSNLLYRVSFVLITLMWKGGTLECRLLLILICDPWYVVSYTLYSAPTACETCLTSKWLKPTGLAYYTLMVALYHNQLARNSPLMHCSCRSTLCTTPFQAIAGVVALNFLFLFEFQAMV